MKIEYAEHAQKSKDKYLFARDLSFIQLILALSDYSSTAAWAAARRAIGTRNGEQET